MTSAKGTYRVRQASSADLLAVLEVLAQNKPQAPDRVTPLPPVPTDHQRATWGRVTSTRGLSVYLAVHVEEHQQLAAPEQKRQQPAGTAAMLLMPHLTYDCRPSAILEAVVVAYPHRRRGVASLLLQRALEDARAASCYKVQLLSHKRHADDGAHELYRSLGFSAEAEGFRLYLDPDQV